MILLFKSGAGICYVAAVYYGFFFVDLLFYVHGKHLRSCRDGQLT